MFAVVLLGLVSVGIALGQEPAPCIIPVQLTFRGTEIKHEFSEINRFRITYDAPNKRKAIFDEDRGAFPGRQLHFFLILNNDNIMYDYNIKTKVCTKSVPAKWRHYGIPTNATFEDEYTVGGPSESVTAQEWSDRVPLRKREYWIGVFSLKDCYPMREFVLKGEKFNDTTSTFFFDVVQGISDPNVFIPPRECNNAVWAKPSRDVSYM